MDERLPYPCFFRAVLSTYGVLETEGNQGPYCDNVPLARETKLPRALEPGERGCIVIRTWLAHGGSVCSIVEFDDAAPTETP